MIIFATWTTTIKSTFSINLVAVASRVAWVARVAWFAGVAWFLDLSWNNPILDEMHNPISSVLWKFIV